MYKITIEKIERREEIVQGDWCVIDKRPFTDEELKDSTRYNDLNSNELKEIRGYAPDKKEIKRLEQTVLEQTVDEIDLKLVIKAINGID